MTSLTVWMNWFVFTSPNQIFHFVSELGIKKSIYERVDNVVENVQSIQK